MNKLLSFFVIIVFYSIFVLVVQERINKLNHINSNIYTVQSKIKEIQCKKNYRSHLIKIIIYYKESNISNNKLTFIPRQNSNLSLKQQCQLLGQDYGKSKTFKAIVLKDFSNDILDLYIGTNHIIKFSEKIESEKKELQQSIAISSFFCIVLILINVLVLYFGIDMKKILNSQKFSWILYFIFVSTIVLYLVSN